MDYIESLMAANERIVYRTKKHWIAPLLASAAGSLLVLGGLAALSAKLLTTTSWLDSVLWWVGLATLLVGLALLSRSVVIWWAQDYFVTNQKVMKVEGIVRKKVSGSGLEKINDITMEQNLLGRWLDFGTLMVLTAAEESNLKYWAMRKPAQFRRAILDQKQLLEQADSRFIASAVREAARPAPPAPGGEEAPDLLASGASPLDPLDIPVLIERLAALHAKGALTDEEFSAKKAELLGRL